MARDAVVPIRLSAQERDQLKEKAKSFQISISEYVRRQALGRRLPPQAAPEINLKTYQELSRIGNNLNQLVRAIHSGSAHTVHSELLRELSQEVKEIGLQVLGVETHDR